MFSVFPVCYASLVPSPHTSRETLNVWRKYDVEHHSYETGEGFNSVMQIQAKDRLRKLTLTSRADRFKRRPHIEVYKIKTGRKKVKKGDCFVFIDTGYNLELLQAGHCRQPSQGSSQLIQSLTAWWVLGILPAHVVEAPILSNAFKNCYD